MDAEDIRCGAGVDFSVYEKLREQQEAVGQGRYGVMENEEVWETAQFMVDCLGKGATDRFLKLTRISTCADLPWKNADKFHKNVDDLPSPHGPLTCKKIKLTGDLRAKNGKHRVEKLELWLWNIVDVVADLLGDASLGPDDVAFKHEKVFRDKDGKTRIFDETWTADWWPEMQKRLGPDATIAPVAIFTNETHLTNFSGGKKAHPVYATVLNISKKIRRSMASRCHVLIGYMPVPKYRVFKKSSRPAARQQFFHDCMSAILEPLIDAGKRGKDMMCCDCKVRHVHPILAVYIADAPEQARVCCTKENRCPKCTVAEDERGDQLMPDHTGRIPTRDILRTRGILETVDRTGIKTQSFEAEGLRACQPFWAKLPHTNIFTAITPDILHQLHIGMVGEHLFDWVFKALKAAKIPAAELDDCFAAIPDYPSLRSFREGILAVSQWTGKERREMERVLIGCLIGLVDDHVIQATRALLDVVHLMLYESHDDNTLDLLQDAIDQFHDAKLVFVDLGIREHFNIPKLHALQHYVDSICLFGSADGYNTEISERLHIDMAKKAYRASNRQDYTSQLVTWLHRQEKMAFFAAYQRWYNSNGPANGISKPVTALSASPATSTAARTSARPSPAVATASTTLSTPDLHKSPSGPTIINGPFSRYSIAKQPSERKVTVRRLASTDKTGFYAIDFLGELEQYLSDVSPHQYPYPRPQASDTFNIYKKIKFYLPSAPQISLAGEEFKESLRVVPGARSANGRKYTSPQFGTALVQVPVQHMATAGSPFKGVQPARVRVIFDLPDHLSIPGITHQHLAYIEWFTPLSKPHDIHGLRSTRTAWRARDTELRKSQVIPLERLVRPVHFIPAFGPPPFDRIFDSDTVLDLCHHFYVNSSISSHFYATTQSSVP